MKKIVFIVVILTMMFSPVVWAETSYFCKTGSVTSTTYPIKISASGGTTWCAVCRVANGTQNTGEFILKKGDPLTTDIIIPPSSFYLMVNNSEILSSLYRTNDSVQVGISYPCCKGVVSWQAQLYTVLPAGTFVAGKKYQLCFQYKQTGIPVGGVVLEGQRHTSPYDPLGLWEYLLLPNNGVVRNYNSVPFIAKTCPGQQRIDFALGGKAGPVSGYFTLIGNVIIKEIP